VNAGTKLQGVMTQTGASGAHYNYSSTFHGIANTTLPANNLLHRTIETLECYGLTRCADLPATADTAMEGIELRIGSTHPAFEVDARQRGHQLRPAHRGCQQRESNGRGASYYK
jgi:hypothetical protein